jgi:hypothetical protein
MTQKRAAESTSLAEPEGQAREETSELLDLVLAPPAEAKTIEGVLVGRLLSLDPPRVVFPGSEAEGVPARAMSAALEAGCEVALLFEGGDPARPVILGPMAKPAKGAPVAIEADGEKIEVEAKEQLVLRCGEASITLTKEGKILLRGVYISSRAAGVHRIQGGSVEIN